MTGSDIDTIRAAITVRTRAVWINSPHNPTGAVMTGDEIAAIASLCVEHDLWLVSDEVYETLSYATPHISPWSIAGMQDRTVVISSLSKSHAAPGFRFGWIIGPPDLIGHLSNLLLCMLYGAPRFIQRAAFEALTHEPALVAEMRDTYSRRASLLTSTLKTAPGCYALLPEGGMFVLLDVRETKMDGETFAQRLLDATGVAVLPCEGFGPSAGGHLRISLTAPDEVLAEAGRRIVTFATDIRLMKPVSLSS